MHRETINRGARDILAAIPRVTKTCGATAFAEIVKREKARKE